MPAARYGPPAIVPVIGYGRVNGFAARLYRQSCPHSADCGWAPSRSAPAWVFCFRPRRLRRCCGVLGRTPVGDAPDRPAGVVGDQQRAVLGDGECGRPAPDLGALLAGNTEAGGEILVIAFGSAVLERHPNDLVAGRDRAVPRALERHEQAALVFRRKLVALVEDQVEERGMRLE